MPVNRDRITVIETVYHQPFGEEAECCSKSFHRELLTRGEEVFDRKLTATNEWMPLIPEECWVGRASMIAIHNEEGKFPAVQPTPEERRLSAQRILEVTYGTPGEAPSVWYILPGESFRGCPSDLKQLYIRTQFGTAKFKLYVFPE